ncbi:hypothetical protein [Paenibacillus bouchesdurhonensis]|uniref:hypothetical protein n=1 Tax=Paenibacillus bouchesdurhonensis TaxID=1870990 RepID=UPI000DA5FDCF|nr:hypothetical protein [Paenibacillus bouchesdurhonensis]
MDVKAILLTIASILIYIIVASILSALAGGSMLKLINWSIWMFYVLIPISFVLSLYIKLNSNRTKENKIY